MPTFIQAFHRHLTQYKTHRLGVKEAGVYMHRGVPVRKGHILPKDLKWLNILESYRAEVQAFVEADPDVKLHKYFHHLNSSQAFALNLFFPFFEGGAQRQLLKALGVPGSVARWRAELVPAPEEGTNVDIAWRDTNGQWTYCEVKLTDAEFGVAKADARHAKKLLDIYGPILADHCHASLVESPLFFANYQILRNVWLAARKPIASVLFLLPRANKSLWAPLNAVIKDLNPLLASRVHVAGVEDVIFTLTRDRSLPTKLLAHAEQMAEKYVLQ